MAPTELSMLFFLQLAVIVAAARGAGWLGQRYLGQPPVVGEMVAGVLLGPSLFGLVAPGLQAALFPADSRGLLYVVAQLGIGLYMFQVGLGFDRGHFRAHAKSAGAVSLAGIAVPFLAAVALAPWLIGQGLFSARIDSLQATLFLGACISITAFPVLARIIEDRGLGRSPLGALALSSGAINDAAAWSVLAVVLATLGDGAAVALKAIGGAAIFAVVVLGAGPRLLAPLGRRVARDGALGPGVFGLAMVLFLLCAFAMDWAGMHAVFGGFLLGVAMPRGLIADQLRAKLQPVTVILLLPVFFTYSGLSTHFGLIADPALTAVAAVVLAASILAKGGACWAAARLSGQANPTALAIGALMNARGLMELIIINIGLQRGLIGPQLFTVLVLMTVVTTLMASPLVEVFYGRAARARGELGALEVPPEPLPPPVAQRP